MPGKEVVIRLFFAYLNFISKSSKKKQFKLSLNCFFF